MDWMQRWARWIAALALVGLVLPFVAGGLSSLLSIPVGYLAVVLLVIVAAVVGARYLALRRRQDAEDG